MEFRILGPLEVLDDGRSVSLGGPKQRALLALLLLHANEVVSRDRLIDELWGDEPPETAATAVHVHVSQLRKALGRDAIETRSRGYVLHVQDGTLDAIRFEQLVAVARGSTSAERSEWLREALALWRGAPLSGLDAAIARAERARLEEQRLVALEQRIDADLALGRHADLVPELDALVREYPLRERFRAQLMLALYRSGRQADALAVYRDGRQVLDELGLEPGEEVRRLERAILEQDPAIGGPPPTFAERLVDTAGRRRRALVLAGVLILAGTLAAVLLAGVRASDQASLEADDQLVMLDARTGHRLNAIPITGSPSSVVSDGEFLWVAEPGPSELLKVDPSSGDVVDHVPLRAPPAAVAVAGGAVWATSTTGGTVVRVSPATDEVVQTVPLGAAGPAALASGRAGLWATDLTDRTLVQIDPVTGKPVKRVRLDFSPTALAVDRSLWVADYDTGTVSEIDPVSAEVLDTVSVGRGPVAVAAGADAVWIANSLDGTVSRIDVPTHVPTSVSVGDGPAAVVIGRGSVWVANRYSGTVAYIDPTTNRVVRRIRVESRPSTLVSAGDRVWAGSGPSGVGHRGGTLVLSTIDPHVGDWGWSPDPALYERVLPTQFTGLAYDTLVTFQHVDGPAGLQLVPDLAVAIPNPSDHGRTYVFHLREGVRYSDGRVVRASDFRRAFERLWRVPGAGTPSGAAHYMAIVGMERCGSRRWTACDLSRGIEVDDEARTVVFHLRVPDPGFLYSLASFAYSAPIPPGTPDPAATAPLPGTGPYRIVSDTPKEIRFVRNPYFREWSPAAQPDGYPDVIVWTFGGSHESVVDSIEQGRADWTFDLIPPAKLAELRLRAPAQVHVNPWYLFQYVALNPHAAPFDDVRVRRALNLALDRDKVARMYGGRDVADPSCQPLVPGLPGYESFCPYTQSPTPSGQWRAPDLARARRLVAASGTRGQVVHVWKWPELAIPSRFPEYLASVLRSLGYRTRLHEREADDRPGPEHQLMVHGDWLPDYPQPSSYMPAFFACHGAHNDQYHYCDPALDRKMAVATSLQSTDPRRAAELWAEVDHEIVNKAWWVPTVTPLGVDLVSSRVGNYRFHPLWGFMADQAWVR